MAPIADHQPRIWPLTYDHYVSMLNDWQELYPVLTATYEELVV